MAFAQFRPVKEVEPEEKYRLPQDDYNRIFDGLAAKWSQDERLGNKKDMDCQRKNIGKNRRESTTPSTPKALQLGDLNCQGFSN